MCVKDVRGLVVNLTTHVEKLELDFRIQSVSGSPFFVVDWIPIWCQVRPPSRASLVESWVKFPDEDATNVITNEL